MHREHSHEHFATRRLEVDGPRRRRGSGHLARRPAVIPTGIGRPMRRGLQVGAVLSPRWAGSVRTFHVHAPARGMAHTPAGRRVRSAGSRRRIPARPDGAPGNRNRPAARAGQVAANALLGMMNAARTWGWRSTATAMPTTPSRILSHTGAPLKPRLHSISRILHVLDLKALGEFGGYIG